MKDPVKNSIHSMVNQEDFAVPQHTHDRIEAILEGLPEKNTVRFRPRVLPKVLSSAAVSLFVFLFLLPNLSTAYAQTMEKVPVLGSIIKVVTIRNYFYDEGKYDMDIKVPEVQEEIGAPINQNVNELAEILLREFYQNLDLSGKVGYGTVHMDYAVLEDSPNWFTLKLTVTQIRASSNSYFKYYHIDKQKGQIVTLQDLFLRDSYQDVLEKEIKSQMQAQMEQDPDKVFWDGSHKNDKDLVQIGEKHNFYWNSQGELVIVFDKYEVGPGTTGCPEFAIPAERIRPLLKPEYRTLHP